MANAYYDNYIKNQIDTASREQLLIMFYDGAIRFVNVASQGIADHDIEKRSYGINKASAIISELSATLDHEIGGQLAADLEALYDFMIRELIEANKTSHQKHLDIVKTLLTDLRETWKEAISQTKKTEKVQVVQESANQTLSVSM